jgi:hypothetical protein
VKEFYWQFLLLLRLRDECGLEVEDEGLLKDPTVIFIFWGALYCSLFLLILDEGMPNRPLIVAYLVFGPGGIPSKESQST